ncbi:MAG TPA: signal peptidase I [Blastocatellia bacterium]|nr:signal peptidase I [Blastocatellia bacterium]
MTEEPSITTTQLGPPKSIIREYAEMILVTGVQVLFLMTFIFQAMNVPTGSMQNTINIGDQFFVNKFLYGKPTPLLSSILPQREVQRGDIVVFKWPKNPAVNYIKRCIGLPGEEILVKDRKVFINGKELPEQMVTIDLAANSSDLSALEVIQEEPLPPGAQWKTYHSQGPSYDHDMKFAVGTPFRIPEGHYFMMGDSRDNSQDSRFWGAVPREYIVGRPLYVYWSFNSKDDGSTNFFNSIKWRRLGTALK